MHMAPMLTDRSVKRFKRDILTKFFFQHNFLYQAMTVPRKPQRDPVTLVILGSINMGYIYLTVPGIKLTNSQPILSQTQANSIRPKSTDFSDEKNDCFSGSRTMEHSNSRK